VFLLLLSLSSSSSFILIEAEWTSFQTHYYSDNLVAPGIESGTSESVVRNSDHYTTEAVIIITIIIIVAVDSAHK
jgi:hypothetical protein